MAPRFVVLSLTGSFFGREDVELTDKLLREEIEAYLDEFVAQFDIDGNGATDALTDGLLSLRYLFGFRGDALTAGA